ncbi:MAG TPA: carbohydrate-binding protein, partial [Candidatus Saccharimonadales bacterium]|nr:carbohydrate-binding protein [Candidatus Saccharimonadales bacterium]
KVPKDDKLTAAILEANCMDGGRAPAGSLNGKATVQLRSRRLQAELADEKAGARILGSFLGAIDHGHYAKFSGLNLADCSGVTFRVASAGSGGRIELRAGMGRPATGAKSAIPSGELLAEVEVKPTGSWDKWVELQSPLATKYRGDVYVVFLNPGKGGLMNLDWVQFNP